VEKIAQLKQQPGKEIQIEGSPTLVQSLMPTGLIDEYKFLVNPIIMGSGKRLTEKSQSESTVLHRFTRY
jgi:dihydrofolate reductase